MNISTETTCSSDEVSAFKKLKNQILQEFGSNAADDHRIERFLKAREFDVRQGYLMLKKDLEWRRKYKVDSILQDQPYPEFLAKYIKPTVLGFDKEGSLIMMTHFGRIDHRGISKAIPKPEVIRSVIYFLEFAEQKLKECSEETGKYVSGCTGIVDMDEFTFYKVSTKYTIEAQMELCLLYEAHYPEKLKKLYVINAPKSTQLLYNILKAFVGSKTLQKVLIFGKDGWQEQLLKNIDPWVLPAYLGGERTDPDGNPMCHSIVGRPEPIPEELYFKNSSARLLLRKQQGVKCHVLKRRCKFTLPLDVQEKGSLIKWQFEIDHYDVDFGLSYKSFDSNDDELLTLIPLQRLDSYMLCETGTFECEKPGIYILTLDNSYSFFRAKNVYYKVSVVKPDEIIH